MYSVFKFFFYYNTINIANVSLNDNVMYRKNVTKICSIVWMQINNKQMIFHFYILLYYKEFKVKLFSHQQVTLFKTLLFIYKCKHIHWFVGTKNNFNFL